jgi:hypothetical protein
MKSRAVTALAALLATFGGVAAYITAEDGRLVDVVIALAVSFVIGLVCLVAGKFQMKNRHPRSAVLLMSVWIVAIVAIGAGLAAIFLWIGFQLPKWLSSTTPSKETNEISKVLLGALTAYAGVLFTEDLAEGKGSLWPSAKTRLAQRDAYDGLFDSDERAYDAAFNTEVPSVTGLADIDGWGLIARWRRAKVLASTAGRVPAQ